VSTTSLNALGCLILVIASGCASPRTPPLPPAGSTQDQAAAFCAAHGLSLEADIDGPDTHWSCWKEPVR
jgi:hypothetical protein